MKMTNMKMIKKVLTIAGSDSGGGAGIQADLKTFAAHGVYGMSVVTAVTAQNTCEIKAVQDMSPDIIAKQLDAVFEDIGADAVKIGMVSRIESIKVIVDRLKKYKPRNIVLDTVMVSKSGCFLLKPEAEETMIQELIPLAFMVTPNIPEAERIAGININSVADMKKAAEIIHKLGAEYVLVKGGHLEGEPSEVLFDGEKSFVLDGKRIDTKNTHGTGCTLSSAIAANLALGLSAKEAVVNAKEYLTEAIRQSLSIGSGAGPLNHFF